MAFRDRAFFAALCLLLLPIVAAAETAIPSQTDISSLCTKYFARAEREYGIPKHLLLAISATESGRWDDTTKMVLPWPWTSNVEGEGHYYETKHDAVIATRRYLDKGKRSIDTGCMQINLAHHPKAFPSVGEAFDPESNVMYAAKFLKANYEETGSWRSAVAAYHSRTPARGKEYFARVKYNWKRALAALGGDRNPYVHKVSAGVDMASLEGDAVGDDMALQSVLEKNRNNAERRKQDRLARRMKIIKVSEISTADRTGPEVLVIRPASDMDTPSKVVVSHGKSQSDEFVTETQPKMIKVVDAGNTMAAPKAPESTRKKGPNFIFY